MSFFFFYRFIMYLGKSPYLFFSFLLTILLFYWTVMSSTVRIRVGIMKADSSATWVWLFYKQTACSCTLLESLGKKDRTRTPAREINSAAHALCALSELALSFSPGVTRVPFHLSAHKHARARPGQLWSKKELRWWLTVLAAWCQSLLAAKMPVAPKGLRQPRERSSPLELMNLRVRGPALPCPAPHSSMKGRSPNVAITGNRAWPGGGGSLWTCTL